jgi:transposase
MGAPIKVLHGMPKRMLSAPSRSKRLAFCQTNVGRVWGNTMFTDRKKFLFKYPGTSVTNCTWVRKGDQLEAESPNHPLAVNIYAGITPFGMTRPHLVTGTSKMTSHYLNIRQNQANNITKSEYSDVLTRTLLPEGKRLFGSRGITSWVLQQDNDPTHKGPVKDAIRDFNASQLVMVALLANWPPHSPDLSPIENVWADIQARVNRAGCKTFEEFKAKVVQEVEQYDKKKLVNLYKSMKKRVKSCIELNGGCTRY